MSDFEPIDFTSIDDIPGINAKALFSSELSKTEFRETGDISPVPIGDKHRYRPWGADDQLPYDILELIERDETLSTCQMFNAEICYGSGLLYNTEACSEKVKEEIDSFFVGNNIPTNYLGVCQDFKYFAFCVNVIILNGDGSKIIRLIRKEACYCRLGVADSNGRIDKLYYANWRKADGRPGRNHRPARLECSALRPYGAHGAHARRRRGNTHENGHKEICRSDKGSYSR